VDIWFLKGGAGDDCKSWTRSKFGRGTDESGCCVVLEKNFCDDVLTGSARGSEEEEVHCWRG
jgi:hypothetical protein